MQSQNLAHLSKNNWVRAKFFYWQIAARLYIHIHSMAKLAATEAGMDFPVEPEL